MNEQQAEQVASAYMQSSGGQGWPNHVREAAAALLPDTDEWAVSRTDDAVLVLAVGPKALYQLRVTTEDDRWQPVVEVRRLAISSTTVRVRVEERFDDPVARRRRWTFSFREDARPLELETRESLIAGHEPGRDEILARALAREVGWENFA